MLNGRRTLERGTSDTGEVRWMGGGVLGDSIRVSQVATMPLFILIFRALPDGSMYIMEKGDMGIMAYTLHSHQKYHYI